MRTDKKVVAESQGKEGTSAAVAIGEPRSGGGSSSRRRNRCGQQCALRGRTTGLCFATGATIRVLHRRSASISRMVAQLWCADRGFAVDRCVLDSAVCHFGRTWVRGLSG